MSLRSCAASQCTAPPRLPFATACLALAAIVFLSGCTPIPRARTLPPTIRSIYIPMAENMTSEPGLEEQVTRYLQREFLADGRLRLEQKRLADAWIECKIRRYENKPVARGTDDFPSFSEMSIEVAVTIRENIPKAPPLGGVRTAKANFSYPSDLRASYATLDVDAGDRLMEELVRNIVREVLTGEYGEATYAAPAEDETRARSNEPQPPETP